MLFLRSCGISRLRPHKFAEKLTAFCREIKYSWYWWSAWAIFAFVFQHCHQLLTRLPGDDCNESWTLKSRKTTLFTENRTYFRWLSNKLQGVSKPIDIFKPELHSHDQCARQQLIAVWNEIGEPLELILEFGNRKCRCFMETL